MQEYSTVVTSNVCPGSFAHLPVDNNDINEETIDVKNTTDARTMVVYQKKKKNSWDLNHAQRLLAIMERDGDCFRPVRALLIKRSVLCMGTDWLLLSMLDMLTKNRMV